MKKNLFLLLIVLISIPCFSQLTQFNIYVESCEKKIRKEDFHGALQDIEKAIKINPNSSTASDAYTYRGFLRIKVFNDYKWSMSDYNKALALKPSNDWTLVLRGSLKDTLRDYSGAMRDYNEAIKITEYNSAAYDNRGKLKTKLNDYIGSIKDFNMAIKLNDTYGEFFYNRGYSKYKLEDYRGAINDFILAENRLVTTSSQIDPKLIQVYFYTGLSKLRLENYEGAILKFNSTLNLNSNFAEAYFYRGISKLKSTGYKDSACLDLSKAGELGYVDAYEVIKKYCK